jgi:hypothetical protein
VDVKKNHLNIDKNEAGVRFSMSLSELSSVTSRAWSASFSEYVVGLGACLRPKRPRFDLCGMMEAEGVGDGYKSSDMFASVFSANFGEGMMERKDARIKATNALDMLVHRLHAWCHIAPHH